MLVSPELFSILSLLALLAGFGIVYFLLRKRLNQKIRMVSGILAGVIFSSFVYLNGNKLLIIDEDLNVENYYLFGGYSDKLKNGKKIKSSFKKNHFGILNKSAENIVIEEIVYQHASNKGDNTQTGDYLIPAYSYREIFLPNGEIVYYFDETIPEKLKSNTSAESKYWLHLVGEEMVEF